MCFNQLNRKSLRLGHMSPPADHMNKSSVPNITNVQKTKDEVK